MYEDVGGQRIYYRRAGKGEPVLILHGWGVTGDLYSPLFLRIAAHRDARVIDFPGFGQSDMPRETWGTEEYAEMTHQLLTVWGWQGVDVVAHSFGARVALRLAHRHPESVRTLALTGAAGIRISRPVPLRTKVLQKLGRAAGALGAPGAWLKERVYKKIGSADYLSAGPLRPILVKVVNEDLRDILPGIPHRTALIWGENDRDTTLEAARVLQAGLKNATLDVIPGAGHYAFLDQPEVFFAHLSKSLNIPA